MKVERSREWWMNRAHQEPDVVISAGPGGPASLDDGDPTYVQDENVLPVTGIVETPPVKPGMGLVRD